MEGIFLWTIIAEIKSITFTGISEIVPTGIFTAASLARCAPENPPSSNGLWS